jgi:hypothetical protein
VQLERRRPLPSAEAETARPPPSVRPALTVGLRGDVLRRSERPDVALTAKEDGPRDMVSLSVLGNERERTSGTSENALSRTCAPSRTCMASSSAPLAAADSRDVFRAVSENERRARPGRLPRRRVSVTDAVSDVATPGVQQADDACIRDAASARAAQPPRSPWTSTMCLADERPACALPRAEREAQSSTCLLRGRVSAGRARGSVRRAIGRRSHDRLCRVRCRRAATIARDHAGLSRRSRAPQQGAALSRRPTHRGGDHRGDAPDGG